MSETADSDTETNTAETLTDQERERVDSELAEALQAIDGVGPQTADKILGVIATESTGLMLDVPQLTEELRQAVDCHSRGRHDYAEKYARNAWGMVRESRPTEGEQ